MKDIEIEHYCIECLRKDIEEKVGRTISTSSDFNFLFLEMKKELNEAPSISTLKRLWAYVSTNSGRSVSILNTISRFIGYKDWFDYKEKLMRENRVESTFLSTNTILSANLNKGDIIVCNWNPGRMMEAIYLGNNNFKTLKVENAKLPVGAIFTTLIFVKGLPFTASNVKHGDVSLGNYIAGEKNGLTLLELFPVADNATC